MTGRSVMGRAAVGAHAREKLRWELLEVRYKLVLCLAHVTNQMRRVEGDFENGAAAGAHASLEVVSRIARWWLDPGRP